MCDYEYQERAAIREYDGGYPQGQAEFFAQQDIASRSAGQEAKVQKPLLEQLLERRDRVNKAMKAESDPEQVTELMTKWKELCSQILELKKGPKR